MGGTDDEFILKATLLLKGCPVPSCSGKHQHEDLPQHCITWWREEGWQMMGWKGSRQNADSAVLKSKINNFRKNFHRRKQGPSSQTGDQQQTDTIEERDEAVEANRVDQSGMEGSGSSCFKCLYQGFLPTHLEESHQCLTAHLKKYLGHRALVHLTRQR